ncbi:oxidoreductase short chain dehydrogenase/reductase family protein [Bacteroides intestinalis CAG:315]|jgi:NAD(P)-dependent dehydrogenase (short-subunit alcohol dehydrogenase family)|uniref:SDR family oxidoreductase n=1 Tax=Bacteroides intestinalis TaxID=329854 RepID=A0A412XTU1_9BACE|nr:SDR family oxidoreductase [Bacteroides intestinalis]RGV48596.1 SDR family oxidoreductase [Bacteroides intestinalis]RHA60923.1 SDR family oxidoreductase [Bacteroides intestinalis]CDD97637.1 oxidoreductase short chain dehydrogenase/reductase family protein [Bacteroides intestinalis CAG:315]
MQNIFSLTGKTILITGASSGIGKAVAQQCAAVGANCIITARNEERLKQTLDSLEGNNHLMVIADLSNNDAIENLVASLPKLNGIVSCAGIVETKVLKFADESDLERLFQTNAFSSIRLIRSLVQGKKLEKEASIVMISSISGVRCGYLGGSIYGATKGALEGFTKAIALELAPRKIRVNTITPGMVESNLLNNSEISEEQLEIDKSRYPMKRYGKPEEVGYAAIYLLSDATKWMTGSSLLIDGGYTLN